MRLALALLLLCAGCPDGSGGGFFDGGDGADLVIPPGSDLHMGPADLSMPMIETTSVQVYVEPGAGLTPVTNAINGAAGSVDMEMYYMEYGGSVAKALISAAKAGKTVRVMLDPAPMQLSNQSVFSELQSGGVQVKWTSTSFTYTHAKMMIVDGKTYWPMTMNMTSGAASGNREYLLVDTDGADVAEAQEVFDHDWNGTPTQATAVRDVVSPINARSRIDWIIAQSTQTLDVEWEELSDSDVGYKIQTQAKAGVHVRIIVPPQQSTTGTYKLLTSLKTVANISIKTLNNPTIHGNMLLVDGKAGFIGSQNATTTSLGSNREFGAIWQNATVASACAGAFTSDWSNGSQF